MKYNESEEMYLESILLLSKKKPNIRAVDVRQELNFAKSSVSKALGLLLSKNYIKIDEIGNITLTSEGYKKAESIYEKHQIITKTFLNMGASEAVAEENACRIEHVITDELFEIIKKNLKT